MRILLKAVRRSFISKTLVELYKEEREVAKGQEEGRQEKMTSPKSHIRRILHNFLSILNHQKTVIYFPQFN